MELNSTTAMDCRSASADFLAPSKTVQTNPKPYPPCGERGRLHLTKTLMTGGHVLLLDEPSNDLDGETLRALEDALLEFAGRAMIISHDRWFLDRICTHILACEGESQRRFFAGNYHEDEDDNRNTSVRKAPSRSASATARSRARQSS